MTFSQLRFDGVRNGVSELADRPRSQLSSLMRDSLRKYLRLTPQRAVAGPNDFHCSPCPYGMGGKAMAEDRFQCNEDRLGFEQGVRLSR